jgi:hypothetical protein
MLLDFKARTFLYIGYNIGSLGLIFLYTSLVPRVDQYIVVKA